MTGPSAARPGVARSAARYSCPMHPEVPSPTDGRCPRCGMKLERVAAAGR
jgi:Cu+-exporting ATPase